MPTLGTRNRTPLLDAVPEWVATELRAGPAMTSIAAVIPTYNAEGFVDTAIRSVLRQTRAVAEIVVADDCSTDDTIGRVASIAAEGHPVRWVRAGSNGGPGSARNLGVHVSQASLIAFLDADDWWEPHHCAEVAGLLDRHPQAVLAFGGWRSSRWPDGPSARPTGWTEPASAAWALLDDNMVLQSAAIVRREPFLQAGGYREGARFAEDFELWNRMAALGPFVGSDRITCVKREHDAQASRATAAMLRAAWEVRAGAHARLAAEGDAATVEKADDILRAAFSRDLASVWHFRDRALMREILSIAPQGVRGMEQVARSWRRRLRFLWPFWRAAAVVWDATPTRVRSRLRQPKRRDAAVPVHEA